MKTDIFIRSVCLFYGIGGFFKAPRDFAGHTIRILLSSEEILSIFNIFKSMILMEKYKNKPFTKMQED